jgi:plastocyanin
MEMRRTISYTLLALMTVFGVRLLAAQHVVSQKDKTFSSATLTVKPGDVVVFKNDDSITHNVFSTSKGLEFNTKAQAPGSSTEVTMGAEGTAEVSCAFHPKMKLTITVKK